MPGYTTSLYGSHRPEGIDAVQFEFGSRYRQQSEIDRTVKAAAAAIVGFYKRYLI